MACNTIIDYSQVIGDKILPFLIQLDLDNSILNPAIGENQRFCYIVTGIGTNASEYADLSHLVLGICNEIPENQIVNITVVINGFEQTVNFGEGGNVELRTQDAPDPPTGCPGLKFNFGLDKVNGVMDFCFELTTAYPVGDNNVCLFGGATTAEGLTICGPICRPPEPQSCSTVGYQKASVCAPVTITPFANAQPSSTFCCGNPVIGTGTCTGTINGSCHFTLSQNICVAVPVDFGAVASVEAPVVQCQNATGEDICTNCDL